MLLQNLTRYKIILFCFIFTIGYGQNITQGNTKSQHGESQVFWARESFGQYDPSKEVVESRDQFSKHFQNETGSRTAHVSSEPMHYLENGSWKTIYNTISQESTGQYKYSNTSNIFKSYYPANIQGGFKTVLDGVVFLEMQQASMYYESDGMKLGELSISNASARVSNNTIVYQGIYGDDIDLLVTQKGGKRKLDYHVRNREALDLQYTNADYLVFSENIILPEGWSAELKNGGIVLFDSKRSVMALYEPPMVNDSREGNKAKPQSEMPAPDLSQFHGVRRDKPSSVAIDESIVYELIQNGSTITILTKVKMEWLLNKDRVFPIVIDPTLTGTVGATGTWWNNYTSPFGPASVSTSGAPANSYITNVNVSLNLTALQYYDWWYGWSNIGNSNCGSWNVFSLDDGATLGYTCGGNLSTWNCQTPNKTWRSEIWSVDGDDYRSKWGYTVTVTYETLNAPTTITGTTSLCAGSATTLSVSGGTATSGSTAITTQWFSGSCGGTLVGTGNSISVSPSVPTTYFVRYTGQCISTGCASVAVNVNSSVNNPGVVSAPASVCVGSAASMSNVTVATTGTPASAGPNYYYYYQRTSAPTTGWVMYDGPTGNLTSALPVAVTGTAGTYLLARNSEFGCAGQVSAPFLNLTIDAAPVLGALSTAGPVDFCDLNGNFTTAVSASGQSGSVTWDWGSNNGAWNGWVGGASSGVCCFPKKTSNSDGNPDRVRYRVTSGSCPAVTSATVLVTNRYNEDPTSLASSSASYCTSSAPASITLTATFPANINKNGTVKFYSGTCGGTLVGSVTAGDNTSTTAITITAPASTTTYFARYEPGTGTGCANSACVSTIVTVSPNNTAGTASSSPTLCISTAMTSITHATTGATGIGTATGLPAGVTASWGSNTINISGTPSASGTFNYSIPLTGGCGTVNATGTITVTANKTAGAASSSPTLCISTAMTSITHATTGATGIGTATGLPAGVTAAWSSNTITISGTPSASGTFNYSIPLTGGCGTVNATGTITVTANKTAGAASSSPTLCIGTAMTGITHATTGATGIGTATGLPAGVTASWATNTITISGTPSASGTFNYSIPLTGGCGMVNATGTIIVVAASIAPTGIAGAGVTICHGNTVTLTASGGSLSAGASYQWFTASCGGTAAGTGSSISVSPSATTTYYVRAGAGTSCPATACASGTITLPTAGSSLATNGQSATCNVSGNNWIHFYTSGGNLIASINPNGNNLGSVTATAFVNGSPILTQACGTSSPSFTTAVLGRRWVITPTNNLPASVRFPFGSTELASLISSTASTVANPQDNISVIGNLKMSHYSGVNQNGNWADNCVSAGGSGGTQLIGTQAGNGVTTIVNGFLANFPASSYVEFNTPGFSEFWLHGDGGSSPLPVELTAFAATCEGSHVDLSWSTASEINSQKFIVEKSRDLDGWKRISEVEAAGNSNYALQYSTADNDPFNGISYYRLVQVDFDGAERIYGPISVSCSGQDNSMIVFPNPTKGSFTVEVSSMETLHGAAIQITDLTGKIIATRSMNLPQGKNQVLFEETGFQLGTYIVKLFSGNESTQFKPVKVVVN